MKTSPLYEAHRALGAQFTQILDWEVPLNYGDPRREHQTTRNAAGIMDLSHRGRIRISGDDRAKFLQGVITNDILKLPEGQGLYAAILNPKGRMLADLKLYALQDILLMDLDREITDKTLQILNRYKLRAKASLEDQTETLCHLGVHGPEAEALLGPVIGGPLPGPSEFSCSVFERQGDFGYVIRSAYTGETGFDVMVPSREGARLWGEILKAGAQVGIQPVGLQGLESLRIEAGLPRYGVDMDENTFPPEAGLEERAISYEKGCYVGQETMARIRTYGQVHRKLMGLVLEPSSGAGASSEALPRHHDKIMIDGQEVGFLTSVAYAPTLGQNIAMGYIRHKQVQPGASVTIPAAEGAPSLSARIVNLPFYKKR